MKLAVKAFLTKSSENKIMEDLQILAGRLHILGREHTINFILHYDTLVQIWFTTGKMEFDIYMDVWGASNLRKDF